MASLTSPDFRERLQAVQRRIAQQYRQGTASVSTASGKPKSTAAVPQQLEACNAAASQPQTEVQAEVEIKSESPDSPSSTICCSGRVAQMDTSYYKEDSDDADSYSLFMNPNDDDDDDDGPFVPSDTSRRSRPVHAAPASQTQSRGPKRSRQVSPLTTQTAPEPKRIRPPAEQSWTPGLADFSQQLRCMDNSSQERLMHQLETIRDLQLQVEELRGKDLEQSQELIRLRAEAAQSNITSQQIEIHQLRANVRNLSNEAKAREFVVQEYLSGWTRAKDDAAELQAQLIDETKKMREMKKTVEALRKKNERTEKELDRATKERNRVVDAVWEVLKFDAIEKMMSDEFGKFGEALMELKGVLAKERKNY